MRSDPILTHWHHRKGSVRAEPVGLVVPTRVVADVVDVAEEERHRTEPTDAGACEGHKSTLDFA